MYEVQYDFKTWLNYKSREFKTYTIAALYARLVSRKHNDTSLIYLKTYEIIADYNNGTKIYEAKNWRV